MTTKTFNTPVDNSSDAAFRTWGSELSSALAAAGLVKTSDTGQINWTTVVRPGSINSDAGYEIWAFNDSLQSSKPIFVRLNYGIANSTTIPRIQFQVGTSTNGSGVIGGVNTGGTALSLTQQGTLTSTTTNYPSYLCVAPGYFGLMWKYQASSNTNYRNLGFVQICRTCDDTSAITGDGVHILYGPNTAGSTNTSGMHLNFNAAQVYGQFTDASSCLIYGQVSASLVGTDIQFYKHFMSTPRTRPVFGWVNCLSTEVSQGTSFTIIPVGTTISHTFLALGIGGQGTACNSNGNSQLCMLWE